ncbi:uncharacterized protein LOC129217735 [Uloborus diversus]|uniref:uncharacterized protein LOC129217735 n=1 Tax=Uloborus diversus TaxID=327109 RepID=UPI00240A1B96|nr:uncharacterized protein LOC129217735 [Uloborus diversus]
MWNIALLILFAIQNASAFNCRLTMKEPKGVIATPNFPDPYPVPINCQWVIEAPTEKVIVIYFTQLYMREGLKVTEYAFYSQNVMMGKHEFGTISSDREPTYLVSNKPVLVLEFAVREPANIHMRVRDYLLDVFGFNITYEFLSRNESVRKDPCIDHHCSFTGNCYATAEYDKYYCSCFSKYFGDECQYDSDCGPTASRNMCQNGGTCRYYIGSTVRTCECPPGYDGAKCETKKIPVEIENDCAGPSCNVTCLEKSADGDNICRAEERRMRFVISLKLTNPKVNTFILDRKKMESFKKEMEHSLSLMFKGRLEVMENITVIDVRQNSIMTFHLLAKKDDAEELKSSIEQMLELGKLGSFDFDHKYQDIYFEPALHIGQIEASEHMPVAEGTELTLACMVQGSRDLKVEWFRDGQPVHTHDAERSMWKAIVPKNSQEEYTALLGFDRVVSLDSGTFTCQATDFGFIRNRSIYVYVQSAPVPQLTPMTATVPVGSPLVITCLSRDDVYGDFGYTWLKNGRVLNPSAEPEMAEDLFPAGSRILLAEATTSAVYSCIITSSAGSTRKDSVITVVDRERSLPCCQPDDYLKVRWTLTAANTENIQQCPTGYTGDVVRKCSSNVNSYGAVWEEPDFSGCFSNGFTTIKKKVESLRLGYLLSDAATLLSRLKRYIMSKKTKLHFCEGEPIVDVLEEIQGIKHGERKNQDSWPTFLDIASVLLESSIFIRKHSKLIKLHELIFKYGVQYIEHSNDVSFELFERKVLDLLVLQTHQSQSVQDQWKNYHAANVAIARSHTPYRGLPVELGKVPGDLKQILKLPSHRFSPVSKFAESPPLQYPWMTNSVEIDLSSLSFKNAEGGNTSASIVVVFYKNLSSHLPQRFFTKKGVADVEYQLISSLVGVQVRGDLGNDNISIRIFLTSFNYTTSDKNVGWNISCAMADFSRGTIEFNTNGCYLVWNVGNNSVCQCHKLGTYALLLTHYALPEEIHAEVSFDVVAGSGVAICAFLVLITISMLLSLWRKVRGAIVALKIQICVALLGAFGLFFCGLVNPISEEFFSYTVSLIQFFLLTAFSLQLCLTLAVYIESVELKNVQYSFVKIAALGWAIPVIIVGATLAAQSLEGYVLEGWWLTLGSNFFYAYTSSILILTMFQVLLFLIVKTEVKSHGKVADFLQSKKVRVGNSRIKLLHRSLLLTTTLLFMSMASILYVNFRHKIYEYIFAFSSVMVGLVVFLSYTFCSERHFLRCCIQEKHDQANEQEDSEIRSRTDSFKSFLKPEIVDDPYSRKMHIDAEKRAERIKRMYSQIEKASLSDTLNSRGEASVELLGQRHFQQPESMMEDAHTPIFKPYQHPGVSNGSPHHMVQEGDAFCDPLERGDGYPKMQWRYANHPHIMYGSPRTLGKHEGPACSKRTLLLDSDQHGNIPKSEIGTCSQFPSSFSASSTFESPQTVKADVIGNGGGLSSYTEAFSSADNFDDSCSLKTSCFLQHTDSLETVVHCDVKPKSEAPLRSISRDANTPRTQSWNMTTV